MICKNCNHEIIGFFTEKAIKEIGYRQQYSHYCSNNHSPNGNREKSGHASQVCCRCGCSKPEPSTKAQEAKK